MQHSSRSWLTLVYLLGSVPACGGADNGQGAAQGDGNVGKIELALVAVPSGVQCIEIDADQTNYPWTHLATQTFAATPGSPWSGTATLGGFTSGAVTVTAKAFNAACASIGATPSWAADPVVLDLRPGVPGNVTLNFRQNFGVMATANFASSVVAISMGALDGSYGTAGLLLSDGTVRIVGALAAPTGLSNVAQLAVGTDHACVRKTDGTVWCWGQNAYGQLGNGTTTASISTPVQVTGITGATTLAAGYVTSCASTKTTTYCWGFNGYGALGNNSTTNSSSPVVVSGLGFSAQIATSADHTCAISKSSDVYCWGNNTAFELGTNVTTSSKVPLLVQGTAASLSVTVGNQHTCATTTLGTVKCWGINSDYQVGNGSNTNSSTAAEIPGIGPPNTSEVVEVEAGISHTCARTIDGDVYCWGRGAQGALGLGNEVSAHTPAHLALSGVTSLATAVVGSSNCALMHDASVQCWGDNSSGQLGDGTQVTRFKPVPMQL